MVYRQISWSRLILGILLLTLLGCYQTPKVELSRENQFGHEWLEVSAGLFEMGSNINAQESEKPKHELHLDTFWMSKHETTNAQYKAFIDGGNMEHMPNCKWNSNGTFKRGMANHPVVCVSWYDAIAYAEWLSNELGEEITLPSEAQWEKAASWDPIKEEKLKYPWGNDFDETDYERCGERFSCSYGIAAELKPVGLFPAGASPYGVEDLSKNVQEWTLSKPGGYPYDPNNGREEIAKNDPSHRMVRGGYYTYQFPFPEPNYFRWFGGYIPTRSDSILGFRVVKLSETAP